MPEQSAHETNGAYALLLRNCIIRKGLVRELQTLGTVL